MLWDCLDVILAGGVGQPDDGEQGDAGRDVYFHADDIRVDAEDGARIHLR